MSCCPFLSLVSPSGQDTASPLPRPGFWSHVVVTRVVARDCVLLPGQPPPAGESSPLPLVTRSLYFRSCFLLGVFSSMFSFEKLRSSPLLPTSTGLCGKPPGGPFHPTAVLATFSICSEETLAHVYIHTHTHACTHMHTCMHTETGTHAHTNIHTCGCTGMLITILLEIVRTRKPCTLPSVFTPALTQVAVNKAQQRFGWSGGRVWLPHVGYAQ